jgi:hypothetical protein
MSHPVNPFALTDAITPWALRAAATLRLPDLIKSGVNTADALATEAGADPTSLRRLLRYLTVRGVFAESDGVYTLNDAFGFITKDHPYTRLHWLDVDGAAGRIEGAAIRLVDSIRTGKAAYANVYGQSFYDDLAGNPELAASYNALMATHATYFDKVVAGYDWTGVATVFDVGGGTGALLTDILRANPQLTGTVVDLPTVVKGAEERFAKENLSDRATVYGTNIFEDVPTGADVYFLSNVLHDWTDDEAVQILEQVARAAGDTGKIVVVQILVDTTDTREVSRDELMFITQMDLRMLALLGGRERSLEEFTELAARAGLAINKTNKIETGQTLMEMVPAS